MLVIYSTQYDPSRCYAQNTTTGTSPPTSLFTTRIPIMASYLPCVLLDLKIATINTRVNCNNGAIVVAHELLTLTVASDYA